MGIIAAKERAVKNTAVRYRAAYVAHEGTNSPGTAGELADASNALEMAREDLRATRQMIVQLVGIIAAPVCVLIGTLTVGLQQRRH
jgi:hypothetical protein